MQLDFRRTRRTSQRLELLLHGHQLGVFLDEHALGSSSLIFGARDFPRRRPLRALVLLALLARGVGSITLVHSSINSNPFCVIVRMCRCVATSEFQHRVQPIRVIEESEQVCPHRIGALAAGAYTRSHSLST